MLTCQYCRTANRRSATYCNSCGGLLKGGAPSASAPVAHPTPRPANATGRLLPQTRLAGCYLILRNVGQGGMAAVYEALDTRNNVHVALKEMSQDSLSPEELQEAMDSFRFEADTLMRLRHPNLPRVYGRFSEGARHYLVMDFIQGQTLEQRQEAAGGKALAESDVLAWAAQLCAVLGYLHMQRPPIIFRDLKPANIMVTANGQIKLIDFGIARVFAPGRTRDTQVLGTPGFAPPEQYGKAQTDARADIYALGCTLYQLLSGYDPATTPFALPPISSRNPSISPRVQQAIERATKLTREERFASADEFARALAAPTVKAAKSAAAPAKSAARATAPHPAARATFPHPAASAASQTASHPAASAARAAPPSMAALVVVQPHALDFGRLVAGQRGTIAITIGGQGNIPVHGQIAALSPWLSVDRTRFDGPSTVIQVHAETSKLTTIGAQQSTLQITCDNQQLFVPVSTQVDAAPAAKQKTAAPQQSTRTAQPKPGKPGKSAKHGLPVVQRGRGIRFLTGLVLAFVLAGAILTQAPHLLTLRIPAIPETAPIAVGMLLLATLAATLAAVGGAGGSNLHARLRTALFGALVGLAAALTIDSRWLLAGGSALLTAKIAIPPAVTLLVPLLVSAGAAIGADERVSQWMRLVGAFAARRMRLVVTAGAMVLGGWAGFLLTQGIVCLTPFGIIGGILLGLTLAAPTNRLLQRLGAVQPARAYSPRYPRYRRGWP